MTEEAVQLLRERTEALRVAEARLLQVRGVLSDELGDLPEYPAGGDDLDVRHYDEMLNIGLETLRDQCKALLEDLNAWTKEC